MFLNHCWGNQICLPFNGAISPDGTTTFSFLFIPRKLCYCQHFVLFYFMDDNTLATRSDFFFFLHFLAK